MIFSVVASKLPTVDSISGIFSNSTNPCWSFSELLQLNMLMRRTYEENLKATKAYYYQCVVTSSIFNSNARTKE
jgi:hypothetical protein